MHVRKATQSDVREIEALLLASYSQVLRADYSPDVLAQSVPVMAKVHPDLIQSGRYLCVEKDGKIIGAGGWSMNAPDGAFSPVDEANIRKVAVDPGLLRSGAGKALVNFIHDDAVANGVKTMVCLSSVTAQPFYAALGYVGAEVVDIPTLSPKLPFRAIRMVRQLA